MRETLTGAKLRYAPKYPALLATKSYVAVTMCPVQTIRRKEYCMVIANTYARLQIN